MLISSFNTHPYYDDYAPEKGFHRILFNPGVAVQGRELTQLQTILQEQIARFGSHVFVEGSVVVGCAESTNFNVPTVKILDRDYLGIEISDAIFDALEGAVVVGQTTGIQAVVRKTLNGSETELPNLKTLYVQYISSGTEEQTTFDASEVLLTDSGISLITAGVAADPIGSGSLISIGEGIIFAKGAFVYHAAQTGVVDRYGTAPTKKVGLQVIGEVVNYETDSSLLDPARGTYNYLAPGADRYKLSTTIVSLDPSETVPDGFFVLFDIEDGKIKRKYNTSQYAELNKTLARRTFDESGDYTVRPFPLIVKEHLRTTTNNGRYLPPEGNPEQLVIAIEPGKAYVRGYEHELFSTEYVTVDKATDTEQKQNHVVSTRYGTFIEIDNVSGVWPIGTFDDVALMDGATQISLAKVRDIEYIDGTTYRLYLYNIRTTGDFSLIDRVIYGVLGSADVVDPTLKSTKTSANIFNVGYNSAKEFDDTSFVYTKTFSAAAVSSGIINVSVSSPETFAFSSVLGNSNDLIVVYSDGTYRDITSAVVSGSTLVIELDDILTGTATVYAKVRRTASHNSKILQKDRYVVIDTAAGSYTSGASFSLGVPDVISVSRVWSADNTVTIYPDNPDSSPTWTDVTDLIELNTGQTDATYELATIRASAGNAGAFVAKKLIVKFTYFQHTTTSPYYSVESYPLPETNATASPSQIEWHEIPTYTSSGGTVYNLRDCLDFRPTVIATATPGASPSTAPETPNVTATGFISNSIHPATDGQVLADVTYFLPRIDRVVLNAEGVFSAVRGNSSQHPIAPRQPDNAMTLGFVSLPAFPTMSPFVARQVNNPSNAAKVSLVDNRRFTMKDIGQINRRVDRLEYFTKLSLLEQSTAKLLIGNSLTNDRFKNGILVDPFFGHNIGNVLDDSYNCSISNNELRPSYTLTDYDFALQSTSLVRTTPDAQIVVRQPITATKFSSLDVVSNGAGASGTVVYVVDITQDASFRWTRLYLTNVTTTPFAENNTVTSGLKVGSILGGAANLPALVWYPPAGALLTLPYIHQVYARNAVATRFRQVSDSLSFVSRGILDISPSMDLFMDTGYTPEVLNNPEGKLDNWKQLPRPWETEWDVWIASWQGTAAQINYTQDRDIDEFTLSSSQRESATTTPISPSSQISTNVGTREISTDVLPWMRSRVITFSARQMKNNTRVYPFFDGVDVSAFCTPTGGTLGDVLTTSATGTVSGTFIIPENTFTTGSKVFVLSDNSAAPLSGSSVATTTFTASGAITTEESNIVSTNPIDVTLSRQKQTIDPILARVTSLSATSNIDDPMAQTFIVTNNPGGMLLTKVDLFFRTRAMSDSITIQLRDVVNGVPGDHIVPNSSVTLTGADINVSLNASAPTTFVFPSPVYLKNDTEYCVVVVPSGTLSGSTIWTSEVGSREIGGTLIADRQPNFGQLFISGNGQNWTNLLNENLKATFYSAQLTAFSGTATFSHVPDVRLRVKNSAAVSVNDTVLSVTGGYGRVAAIDRSTHTLKITPLNSESFSGTSVFVVTPQTGTITTTTATATVTGTGTTFTALAVDDVIVAPTGAAIGTVNAVTDDTTLALDALATTTLTGSPWFVRLATLTEATVLTTTATAIAPTLGFLNLNNTEVSWQYQSGTSSPVALSDVGTTELPTVITINDATPLQFIVNVQSSVATISPLIDAEKIASIIIDNKTVSDYVSRRVVLDDGQEAEDFRVYINAAIPPEAQIRVYAKLQSIDDTRDFNSLSWTELTANTAALTGQLADYFFTLPSDALNLSGVYTYGTYVGIKTFAVRIRLDVTNNRAAVPVINNMRAIALQA
jgi:hypothetical protein